MTSDNNGRASFPGGRRLCSCTRLKSQKQHIQETNRKRRQKQQQQQQQQQVAASQAVDDMIEMISRQDNLKHKRQREHRTLSKMKALAGCWPLMTMIISFIALAGLALADAEPQAKLDPNLRHQQTLVNNRHLQQNYHSPSSHQLRVLAQDINGQLSSPSSTAAAAPVETTSKRSHLHQEVPATEAASIQVEPDDEATSEEPSSSSSSSSAFPPVDGDETVADGGDEEAAGDDEPEQPVAGHQHSRRQLDLAEAQRPPARQSPPLAATTTMATFEVGLDKMMIKPHEPIRVQFGPASRTAPASPPDTTTTRSDAELATESANHVMLTGDAGPRLSINERRQDLLYPSSSSSSSWSSSNSFNQDSLPRTTHNPPDQQQQQPQEVAGPMSAVCYTPFALLMIIIITMLVTCFLCFCTHYLIKHFGRHQFDLVANSKHFDHLEGASNSRGQLVFPSSSFSSSSLSPFDNFRTNQYGPNAVHQHPQTANGSNNKCLLHLFQPDSNCNKCAQAQRRHSVMLMMGNNANNNNNSANGHQFLHLNTSTSSCFQTQQQQQQQLANINGESCAFKNPYFTGDDLQVRQETLDYADGPPGNLIRPTSDGGGESRVAAGLLQTTAAAAAASDDPQQQLHFIEHHIANLHNRQVTSSVKELSILGNSPNNASDVPLTTTQIVDLTSDEQRARVINDPKEGDLIAVDISGHDIIGLGFDVCGNEHEGIFVRSVHAHGPARESACIQPGDRIKCLNVSFDQVTLQDARDILNCGAPYKMRLLLEKKCLPEPVINRLNKLNSGGGSGGRPTAIRSAAKSYLRKLTSRVVGGGGGSPGDAAAISSPDSPGGQQAHLARVEPPPLGSLQARQELARSRGDLTLVSDDEYGHTNEAFGADDDDDESSIGPTEGPPKGQLVPATDDHMSRRPSRRMRSASGRASHRTKGHSSGGNHHHQQPKSSSTIEINGRTDVSSPAPGRDQHHKLRGPPTSDQQVADLSRDYNDRLMGRSNNHHNEDDRLDDDDQEDESPAFTSQSIGRRTVDATTIQAAKEHSIASASRHRHSQSQPEISAKPPRAGDDLESSEAARTIKLTNEDVDVTNTQATLDNRQDNK